VTLDVHVDSLAVVVYFLVYNLRRPAERVLGFPTCFSLVFTVLSFLLPGPESSKSSNDSSGDNIIVGFRVRPPRSVESVGDAPAVSTRGKEVRIERPTLQGAAEKHTFAFDFTFGARRLNLPCTHPSRPA